MDSIIQSRKECFACGTTFNLHSHHIFFGTANRKQSEKYGLKVWLCIDHHTGKYGVHNNKPFDEALKMVAQSKFESTGTREEFRSIFGKSYI